MARRLIIAAGWLAAAVLAVLVGLVAVSVIGDGLVSPLAKPLTSSEVAKELAAAPDESVAPSPAPPASSSPAVRTFPTRAGTVVAACEGDNGVIRAMSPAQGFAVHERGGNEGEFRGVADDHDRVKIEISCEGGRPEAEISSETDDDD